MPASIRLPMTSAPFDEHRDVVRPEWIDDNGHLNMGYYVVAFDRATDTWLDHIGLSANERARSGAATFTLESHVNYLREVREAAPAAIHDEAARVRPEADPLPPRDAPRDGRVSGRYQRAHVSSREPGDTTGRADRGGRARPAGRRLEHARNAAGSPTGRAPDRTRVAFRSPSDLDRIHQSRLSATNSGACSRPWMATTMYCFPSCM